MTYQQMIDRDIKIKQTEKLSSRKAGEKFQNVFLETGFTCVYGESAALAVCKRDGIPVTALERGGGHDRSTGGYATATFFPTGEVHRQFRELVPYEGYHYQVASERWDQ